MPQGPKTKVNFLCPDKLLEKLDRIVKESGQFRDRTDALVRLIASLVDTEGDAP